MENRYVGFEAVRVKAHRDFSRIAFATAVAERPDQQQNRPLTHLRNSILTDSKNARLEPEFAALLAAHRNNRHDFQQHCSVEARENGIWNFFRR
jgi:hypothetical protein